MLCMIAILFDSWTFASEISPNFKLDTGMYGLGKVKEVKDPVRNGRGQEGPERRNKATDTWMFMIDWDGGESGQSLLSNRSNLKRRRLPVV